MQNKTKVSLMSAKYPRSKQVGENEDYKNISLPKQE